MKSIHVKFFSPSTQIVSSFFFFLSSPNLGFPGGSDGKESVCNAGDLGWIPGLGRSPGEGNGYTLQYSCQENPHGQRSLVDPWGWTQPSD